MPDQTKAMFLHISSLIYFSPFHTNKEGDSTILIYSLYIEGLIISPDCYTEY